MVTDAHRVGHDGQGGIDRPRRTEAATVHDVEIVEFVRLAIRIKGGGLRVMSESNRAALMCDARQRDALPNEQVSREHALVTISAMNAALALPVHQTLERADQTRVALFVIG